MTEQELVERCLKCHLRDHCGAWQHIINCGQVTP